MLNFSEIKLIIWDLDETLWNGTFSDNESIYIRKEFVDFINASLDRGIVHSICSKNDFDSTKAQLLSLDLWDLFVFPSINWAPKGERINQIIKNMKLRPQNTLFVDDNTSNLREACYYCPTLQTCTPEELLQSRNNLSKISEVDTTRPRLAQYRLLEEKLKSQEKFSSNEDFLMSCNIRVEIHKDCLNEIDRIHNLILRSNQLNYTKFRQDKEALLEALSNPDADAAYITVSDSFGDYGIVGFYLIVNQKVIHYLFSCRTLGMLVEQYVYMQIGCPKIEVVGDVVTKLNTKHIPLWINQKDVSNYTKKSKENTGDLKILFKGPCDIRQIFSFIEETPNIKTEFTYVSDKGISIEGYSHTSQMVTALKASEQDKAKLINDTGWLDEYMLSGSRMHGNDVIVFSLLTDGNLGIYQHKETGWQIAFGEAYYDLTDPKNWKAIIEKTNTTNGFPFTEDFLVAFSSKFTYVDNSTGAVTVSNIETIYDTIGNETSLILMLGSEIPFIGPTRPSWENRHLLHQALNQKIRNWTTDKKNVHLIEFSKYVSSQKDYEDTINHLQKEAYYHMAQDILAILNKDQEIVRTIGWFRSYRIIFWRRFKRLIQKASGRI